MSTPFRFHQAARAFETRAHEEYPKAVEERMKIILGDRPSANYSHGDRWASRTTQGDEQETQFKQHSFEHEISVQEVLNGDMGALDRHISTMANGMFESMQRELFKVLAETCDTTGNQVTWSQSKDDPGEVFLAGLDKMEWGVDEDGKPTKPSIFLGPENPFLDALKKVEGEAEFSAKVVALTKKKQDEAIAREHLRKSKFKKPQ